MENSNVTLTTLYSPHETVHIAIYVKVGTKHEGGYPAGIAHFTEHMLFKGTEQFTAQAFSEEIDALGGEVNAYTTKEYTCYAVKTLRRFEIRAVQLLQQMLMHATFPAEEIEREKQVILEEIKMTEDDPEDYIYDMLQEKTLSADYHVPILGTRASLQQMTKDALNRFYREFYTADNIIISYAGQNPEVIQQLQTFPAAQNARTAEFTFSPCELTVDRSLEQAHLLLGYKAVSYHHPLYDACSVFSAYFGESMSSPLFRRLREELGLCYNVYSSLESFADGGLFTIYIGCDQRQIESAKREMLSLIGQPMTAESLQRTKDYLITTAYMDNDYEGHIMARDGRSLLYYGRLVTLTEFESRINAVTLAEIAEVQQLYKVQPAQIIFK
ncbi:M16 family metallopeptidase [Macrococcus carouselicus]|uniref:Insulinase family protein n=1 Tax=Macrococcus carouselicus TaxID=69969 RepID=A0A9Q8CMQ7_9STAP|nr:pitrilysin family protein [Macrococcus carouselicus]TDM04112.1 insulinase family protein [Macrococcus carouselicus]